MKATGNLQTIVIFDCGQHGADMVALARKKAPGAIVEYRECGTGTSIDYAAAKKQLREFAKEDRRFSIIQFSWGLPGWIGEEIPPWASDPEKGMEDELREVWKRGHRIVAAAGDDSQGGKIGANYPACSPYCVPAMGAARFCNRTRRGLVCNEESASRAASELSAAIAMVRDANGLELDLTETATDDEFPRLQLGHALASLGATPDFNPPIHKHQLTYSEACKVKVTVEPPTKIIRYTGKGAVHWERFSPATIEMDKNELTTIGIMGAIPESVAFRRAAA